MIRADKYMLAGNFQYIDQIARDWVQSPFVELKVEYESKGCNDGWDPVFTRIWGGSTKKWKLYKIDSLRCEWVYDAEPIEMTDLGSIICGKRGGNSFAVASRPGLDGTCSDGLIPCSNSTSPKNTICVSIED